jgi:hypothetical protein
MGERAQFTTPRWVPPVVIGTAVLVVVADAVLEAQREAMTQCAPDCQLGAPLFAHVGAVEAVIVAAVLLAAAVGPVVVRRRWGERDERQ